MNAKRRSFVYGLLGALTYQAKAYAAPQTLRLEYLADDACPSATEFSELVTGRTDLVTFSATEGRTARVELHHKSTNDARGTLRIEDFGPVVDPREVQGVTCAEVADALALTLALSIDPQASPRARNKPKPPQIAEPGPSALPKEVPAPRTPASSKRPAPALPERAAPTMFHWGPELSGVVLFSSLPAPLVGGAFALHTAWVGEGASLHTRASFSTIEALDAGQRVSPSLVRAALEGCFLLHTTVVDVGPCVQLSLGELAATGRNIEIPKRASFLWIAPALGVRAERNVFAGLTLHLAAALEVPLQRSVFIEENPSREVAKLSSIALSLTLGAGYAF
jgi:hypothetical protein